MGVCLSRNQQQQLSFQQTIDVVTDALAQAGVESLNLIVGIDFTKSNEWTGKHSFHGRNLHQISDFPNPYEDAIAIIARTLSRFNADNTIPCYGFGDESTIDQDVFSFYYEDRPCSNFNEILNRYRDLVPHVELAGPTSFAPIIEMAVTIVERSGGKYHVLLIIADGQVTRSVDTDAGQLSIQEQITVDALLKASEFPLSVVLVGVGDGPWDTLRKFVEPFRHFQFVNFTEIMSKNFPQEEKEADFALQALMGILSQCSGTTGQGILGHQTGRSSNKVALPPPGGSICTAYPPLLQSSEPTAPPCPSLDTGPSSSSESSINTQRFVCPICLVKLKDMAFGCGHQTCVECSQNLEICPICRMRIQTRIKLY